MASLSPQGAEVVGAETNTANIITSVSSGLANIAGSIWGPKSTPAPQPQTNTWLMPVVIGGVAILGIALIAGKKK